MPRKYIHKLGEILCRNCAFCIQYNNTMECEQDVFKPMSLKQGRLNSPILLNCLDYEPRPK